MNIVLYFLPIPSQDWFLFTHLDQIYRWFAEAPTICDGFCAASSRARSYTIFFLFSPLCLSLCRLLFLLRFSLERDFIVRHYGARRRLEKLFSFHQANSESNATSYNSIRRQRKKCKRKEEGEYREASQRGRTKRRVLSSIIGARWLLYSSCICVRVSFFLLRLYKKKYINKQLFKRKLFFQVFCSTAASRRKTKWE